MWSSDTALDHTYFNILLYEVFGDVDVVTNCQNYYQIFLLYNGVIRDFGIVIINNYYQAGQSFCSATLV